MIYGLYLLYLHNDNLLINYSSLCGLSKLSQAKSLVKVSK